MVSQKTPSKSKQSWERTTKSEAYTLSYLKLYYKAIKIRTVCYCSDTKNTKKYIDQWKKYKKYKKNT